MKTAPGKPLIRARQIKQRVTQIAGEIDRHYKRRPLVILGLMNGSLFFLVDLVRALKQDYRVECWRIASYQGTASTGQLIGLQSCQGNFSGHDVLIVDDILDTGLTLDGIRQRVQECGARRVDVCVLLRKNKSRIPKIKARWVGFEIADEFVIGYGLDLDGRYRSLPEIRVLNE